MHKYAPSEKIDKPLQNQDLFLMNQQTLMDLTIFFEAQQDQIATCSLLTQNLNLSHWFYSSYELQYPY